MMKKLFILTILTVFAIAAAACQPAPSIPQVPTLPVPSTATILPVTQTLPPTQTPTKIPTATPASPPAIVRFAVIGDYGTGDSNEASVAQLVHRWKPDLIITVGDNNYPNGAADAIDDRIGKDYHDYIYPYTGTFGAGADVNRFFPTLGNHDWHAAGAEPYLDYFHLPGNERYYDFTWGPVHFFALDSIAKEPDGVASTSKQAVWLKNALAASTSAWNIVYFHYPPYSSGLHGSTPIMRWPFAEWGANAVLSGHDHDYERLLVDGIPYIVNGLGGGAIYDFKTPLPQSIVRYHLTYGAMLVSADEEKITFTFYDHHGQQVDTYTETKK